MLRSENRRHFVPLATVASYQQGSRPPARSVIATIWKSATPVSAFAAASVIDGRVIRLAGVTSDHAPPESRKG